MANRKVALLLRVKTSNQQRSYLKPEVAANGRIRPLWAVYNSHATHFPDGVYCRREIDPSPSRTQKDATPNCGRLRVS
jgi:hypothetical protein